MRFFDENVSPERFNENALVRNGKKKNNAFQIPTEIDKTMRNRFVNNNIFG